MTPAFISGRLGRAIYESGGDYYTRDVGLEPSLSSPSEIGSLDSDRADFECVELGADLSVQDHLDAAYEFEQALFLVLSSINPGLSFNTRLICARAVDPVLNKNTQELLLSRLFVAILPSEVRNSSGNALETFTTFSNLSGVLRELFESQEAVATVAGSIDREIHDRSAEQKEEIRAEFIAKGVFLSLVRGFRSKDAHRLNHGIVSARLAFREATDGLLAEDTARSLGSSLARLLPTKDRQRPLRLETKELVRERPRQLTIEELISRDPFYAFSKASAFAAKTQVDKQLGGISKQILQGRVDLVDRYVAELVQFQLDHSEREHLAKSLCLLSSVALTSNQLDIAESLSLHAVRLGVHDEVVYTSRAEVLKYMGQFDASLMAYRDVKVQFPESAYAWNGEADVLKEAARFDEALEAYRLVRIRYPDDPVPFNGFVSTLRRMGRLSDALREARRVVNRFHDNAFSRIELGNVLFAVGRYRDAIAAYRYVLSSDPRQVRTRMACARALNAVGERSRALELLRTGLRWEGGPVLRAAIANQYRIMGLLDKGLDAAKAVVLEFPGYVHGRFALASIQLLRGEVLEAADYLPKDNLRSESDWHGYRIYLICLLNGRDPKDAVVRLQDAVERCVWSSQKSRFATVLAVAHARVGNTQDATRILQSSRNIEDHQRQTRMAILGAVNAQTGHDDLAHTILTRLVSTKDPNILRFKTAYLAGNRSTPSVIPLLLAA